MSDYVDRKALLDKLYDEDAVFMRGVAIINQFPAADVAPVVHGGWIDKPIMRNGYHYQSWCSACGKHSSIGGIDSNRHKPYCPNCGAKMDGGAKDAEEH